jgi:polysaccharide biosynthesis protein PslH
LRILVISPQLPFPPITGGKKGIYCLLREIAGRGHHVHLSCLLEEDELSFVTELEKSFTVDAVVHPRKPSITGALASMPSRIPYQVSRFHDEKLLECCRKRLRSESFDIIQLEGIHAAYYGMALQADFDIPTVMRVHDVLSLGMSRRLQHTRNPFMKVWLSFDRRRVRAFEKEAFSSVACNLTVSECEQRHVVTVAPNTCAVVASVGVDLDEFVPQNVREDPRSVLWIGAMNHSANIDSFWWFYHEIVPLIVKRNNDVRIRVVGTAMPNSIQTLSDPNVEILGFVPDVREVLARSEVCVVPLRVGSGVRLKILEMFAMKRAVVSTTVGAEGLQAEDGTHLLIADSPKDFADGVLRLLNDSRLRKHLGETAHRYASAHFGWNKAADQCEAVYRKLVSERSHSNHPQSTIVTKLHHGRHR